MTTACVTHPRYAEHDFPRHPEHAGRIRAVWNLLRESGLRDQLWLPEPNPASDAQILAVHTESHLARLIDISRQERTLFIDQDTYALPASLEVARLAAGSVIRAVDAVLAGDCDNALAIPRPPGHHATPDRQMGFCLLNNIAIAAQHALDRHNLSRALILDYDVHHGNGTQDIFYADERVMFISLHQSPHYPGTGQIHEVGVDAGSGATMNLPLPAGHGDESYQAIFREILDPVIDRFQPQLMLVSIGFDAHFADPLAGMRLSLGGYDWLARRCIQTARRVCDGNIVFVMEGGYDLLALSHGVCNVARALLGRDDISDPYGQAEWANAASALRPLLDEVRRLHRL